MSKSDKSPNFIDLFAGCGGLSLGLHKAGWKGLFAIEKSPEAFETYSFNLISKYSYNWPEWLPKEAIDVRALLRGYSKQLEGLRGKVDLVAGGPPCQGFSMAGRRVADDKRNQLVFSYLKVIELVKPNIVLFENVKGFASQFSSSENPATNYSNEVLIRLRKLGYEDATAQLVDFSEFGVPQRRKRFIIVGSLDGSLHAFFNDLRKTSASFLKKYKLTKKQTVSDAISDLIVNGHSVDCPDSRNFKSGKYGKISSPYQSLMRKGTHYKHLPDSHRIAKHMDSTVKVFETLLKKAPRCKTISGDDRLEYGVKKRSLQILAADRQSGTITSIPDDSVHFSEPRILTARESARLQGFPDDFHFKGKYTTGGDRRVLETPRFTQIGNAIPPLFSEQVGLTLLKTFQD